MGVFRIFDGMSDFASFHLGESLRHGFDVFFERNFAIEAEHRRERLRNARGGNDCTRLLGDLDTSLSGHDDVLVVRQNDD